MQNEQPPSLLLTPEQVRQRATEAHYSINKLMGLAGLQNSVFWRWEKRGAKPHPVTLHKLAKALDAIERERV